MTGAPSHPAHTRPTAHGRGARLFSVLASPAARLPLVAVGAYVWSVRSGQFDDLDTPALRPLIDEPAPKAPERRTPYAVRLRLPNGRTVAFRAPDGHFSCMRGSFIRRLS